MCYALRILGLLQWGEFYNSIQHNTEQMRDRQENLHLRDNRAYRTQCWFEYSRAVVLLAGYGTLGKFDFFLPPCQSSQQLECERNRGTILGAALATSGTTLGSTLE